MGDKGDDNFTAEKVLRAAGHLYAPPGDGFGGNAGATAAARRKADQYLNDFQKSEASVRISLGLLANSGENTLPAEIKMLLATTVRKRLQRTAVPEAPAEEVLRLASSLWMADPHGAGMQVARHLVRAGVAQWLHLQQLPVAALLEEASSGGGAAAELALVTLTALPEEANAREVKIDQTRPMLIMELGALAPRVLQAVGSWGAFPAAPRLNAATQWLYCFSTSGGDLAAIATSPLLPLAGELLAQNPPACTPAVDFLESLIEKCGACQTCPEALVVALLGVLSAARPSDVTAASVICRLVATATTSWRRFFVSCDSSPAAAWVSLLEALAGCASWGYAVAGLTLHAWLGLLEHVAKVGAQSTYATVFARALHGLRAAAVFPDHFETFSFEARDNFIEYRRELRDALRVFTADRAALSALLDELGLNVASNLGSPWRSLEEPVHCFSALAKGICDWQREDAQSTAGSRSLSLLWALAADGGPLLRDGCHRQLLCSFLMCASVYVPFCLPAPPGDSSQSMAARLVRISRAALAVPETVAEGPDSMYPFRVKQDHQGVVCLLRLAGARSGDPVVHSSEAVCSLQGDLHFHIMALQSGQNVTLSHHSVLVLAQAVGSAAACQPEAVCYVLNDCLSLVRDGGAAAVALQATAEVVRHCGAAQTEALGSALAPAWSVLAAECLESVALARLLAAIAEAAPGDSLQPLAQLIAGAFAQRPQTRAALLDVVTALVIRGSRETQQPAIAALAAEMLHGVSALAWRGLDEHGGATARLRLATDAMLRLPSDEGPEVQAIGAVQSEEQAVIEAWARLTLEAGRRLPGALQGEGGSAAFSASIRAACSLVAAPHRDPPTRSLALLSEEWKDAAVRQEAARALDSAVLEASDGPWSLGALQLRSVMKAVLGQMPPNTLGVCVPAARSVFQHGVPAVELWLRRAMSGDGFPLATSTAEGKERVFKELLAAQKDAAKFKQALKRFCGGKKKGFPG